MQIWTLQKGAGFNPLIYIYLLKFAARNARETERLTERRKQRLTREPKLVKKQKHEIINEL